MFLLVNLQRQLTCALSQQTSVSAHLSPQIPTSFSRTAASGVVASPLSAHGSSAPNHPCFPHCPLMAQRPFSWIEVQPSSAAAATAAIETKPASATRHKETRANMFRLQHRDVGQEARMQGQVNVVQVLVEASGVVVWCDNEVACWCERLAGVD